MGETPRPPRPRWAESERDRARRLVMSAEHARQHRIAEWAPYLRAMAHLRVFERLVKTVRDTATDDEAGWAALADAAEVERFVTAKTAAIEGLLGAGRVAGV
jgi:hypothetical protein